MQSGYVTLVTGDVSDWAYLRRLGGRAFETSRRPDVKLILPLMTLAGALTLLFNSAAVASLSYL
jgi:hypothetical protein